MTGAMTRGDWQHRRAIGSAATPRPPLSRNDHLLRWVEKMARLTRPDAIHWVDGSQGGV